MRHLVYCNLIAENSLHVIHLGNIFFLLNFYTSSANPVGDACVDDYDGDGVPDVDDACPHVKHISKTSFLDYFTVDLYPGHSDPKPEWRVAKMVKRAKLKRA